MASKKAVLKRLNSISLEKNGTFPICDTITIPQEESK